MQGSQSAEYSEILNLRRAPLSIEKYNRMFEAKILTEFDRVELINGEIITMSPINSPHAATVRNIRSFLERNPLLNFVIGSQEPIELGQGSVPEPDIFVAKNRADKYFNNHPNENDTLLVVEVADSSYKYDQQVKAPLYAQHGIQEYWIVDLNKNQIEVCTNPKNGQYSQVQQYAISENFKSVALGYTFNVNDLLIISE